ncbi:LTA synthase family protein [Paraburkholderia sp. MMS20-SJTR3]|uniref:LTA synthase family protein n=1 Tax=Paraburkholderia sejongensis TaxID=2886946 RepID=A0ABS8K4W2_9BURK|nr:LTA synthase family protein [Paraburkholderia sp. MMS20-SJTR3]MCC8396969.1 LTA synthase family protein [Paraburkholderia sp. MMS20-SJTR3]
MNATPALSFAAAAALALLPEALAKPRASLRRLPLAFALHVAAIAFICACVVLITGRVHFAAFVAVALVGLLAGVSNAKYTSLREPFVFTDLSLFSQLFAHPRLYLPFLSAGTVVAIVLGIGVVIAAFVADAPLAHRPVGTLLFAACACLAAAYACAARLPLTLQAVDDQQRHGFFAVFVAYLLNGMRPATARQLRAALAEGPFASGAPHTLPDVILIQSESFFDARRLSSRIDPSILRNFDLARRASVQHGELTVPAWGANTMRTEFAVLTGVDQTQLGYARFYPYAFIRRACASLASWFKHGGYRTLAIHPYYADFFGRERAFEHLQIDRFIDIKSFADAARAGPYVADMAVAEAIIKALDEPRDKPVLIFSMTMENHGPLHLETVEAGEGAAFHSLGDDAHWRDLTAYLRHLANADAMLGRLLDALRARRRDTVLCFYGDHVPALPHVFARLRNEPARSDYFIWRNYSFVPSIRKDISAEELGVDLVKALAPAAPCEVSARTLHPTEER